MEYKKCNNCGGMGTILDHLHQPHSGQRTAGMGKSVCPACNGSGKSNTVEDVNGIKSDSSNSLNAWAYIIFWLVLFYITYLLYTNLLEMIFGEFVNVSDFVKWLNVVIIAIPPTIIVYKFRRAIPGLFAIGIVGGILAILVTAVASKM